jgi:ectoine hydroxylase-related dioxygenase (phytanoyl-CoA dioxygenase family)
VPHELLPDLRDEATELLRGSSERGGARNAMSKSILLRELALDGPLAKAAREVLGPGAVPTKLTIFDKNPAANWKVPWHQDLTIRVRERFEVEGYGPWSVKDGEPHVQPPVGLLEQILAIRLHLDDATVENGALRVIPGSHRFGRLAPEQIAALRQQHAELPCPVPAGGAMLMRPLLLHASSTASAPSRRRVAHFEFCAIHPAAPLSWD